jgi:hypothetical protein
MNPISFFRRMFGWDRNEPQTDASPSIDVPHTIFTSGTFLSPSQREALMVNEKGEYMVQFPNHDAHWAKVDLDSFVPTQEFSDCVFGEINGTVIKLFWSEISEGNEL